MKLLFRSVILLLITITNNGYACSSLSTPLLKLNVPASLTKEQATQQLDQWLLSLSAKHATNTSKPEPTLELINCYLTEKSVSSPKLSTVAPALHNIASLIVNAQTVEQRDSAIISLNRTVNRDAGSGFVQFPNGADSTIEVDLYQDFVNSNCTDSSSSACSEAFSLAAHLWWFAAYYRSIPDFYNDENIISSLAFNDRLNKKWLSYKDDTILLWPQEVLLNSLVFKQQERGFTEPPSYKLLSLRPSIGLSYLTDESHHIQPTLNIDLLGIYWWKYGGDNSVTAQPGKGLATTLIWDGRDTAFGLTYHHNPKWSATIAHGKDNDLILSISFQLAHWLL